MKSWWTVGAASVLAIAAPVAAQTFPLKWASYNNAYFRGSNRIVLPTYQITYIVSQQATAVGGGAKARSTMTLTGIDEALMRRLADEAQADLRAQLVAAGFPLASDQEAQAMVAANGIPLVPGNIHVERNEGGITVNKSVKLSYVTVGASAAPSLEPYRYGANYLGMIKFNNQIAKGQPQNTLAVIPHLVLDFASMGAWVNSNTRWSQASVGGALGFTMRGVSSGIFFVKVLDRDRMFPFFIRPEIDVAVSTPFARVEAGGAEVAPLMVGGTSLARGDAVVVDRPAWEALVRQAYKDYNSAIVAAVVRGRG